MTATATRLCGQNSGSSFDDMGDLLHNLGSPVDVLMGAALKKVGTMANRFCGHCGDPITNCSWELLAGRDDSPRRLAGFCSQRCYEIGTEGYQHNQRFQDVILKNFGNMHYESGDWSMGLDMSMDVDYDIALLAACQTFFLACENNKLSMTLRPVHVRMSGMNHISTSLLVIADPAGASVWFGQSKTFATPGAKTRAYSCCPSTKYWFDKTEVNREENIRKATMIWAAHMGQVIYDKHFLKSKFKTDWFTGLLPAVIDLLIDQPKKIAPSGLCWSEIGDIMAESLRKNPHEPWITRGLGLALQEVNVPHSVTYPIIYSAMATPEQKYPYSVHNDPNKVGDYHGDPAPEPVRA